MDIKWNTSIFTLRFVCCTSMCSATKVTTFFHGFFPREFPSRRWYKCHGFLLWLLGKWRVAWGEKGGIRPLQYPPFKDVSQSHVNNGTKYQPPTSTGEFTGIGGMSWGLVGWVGECLKLTARFASENQAKPWVFAVFHLSSWMVGRRVSFP